MAKWILKWVGIALAILATPYLVSGFKVASFGTALALALVLGLLNSILKPILILLTFPFTLVSFGLFLFVVNGFVFWLSAQVVNGVQVESFGTAFWASLIVSIVTSLLSTNVRIYQASSRASGSSRNSIDLEKDSDGRWGAH